MNFYNDIAPSGDEILIARQSYLDWERAAAQEQCESDSRSRTVELAELVDEIVENNLGEIERSVVKKYWYEQKTVAEIADEMRLNKSTVSRALDKSSRRIEELLQYAVKYRYNLRRVDFLPLAVRQALLLQAQRHFEPKNIGERLRKLRESEGLDIKTLSAAASLSVGRITALEQKKALPTAEEIIIFSSFFNTSADYILKGGVPLAGKDSHTAC